MSDQKSDNDPWVVRWARDPNFWQQVITGLISSAIFWGISAMVVLVISGNQIARNVATAVVGGAIIAGMMGVLYFLTEFFAGRSYRKGIAAVRAEAERLSVHGDIHLVAITLKHKVDQVERRAWKIRVRTALIGCVIFIALGLLLVLFPRALDFLGIPGV